MIEVNNISLKLGGRKILDSITLTFKEGTISGLVGNNGCGKTMLMKCICGFVRTDSGQIVSDGKVIRKDCDYLENAGVIIENPGFLPHYTGIQNLKLLAGLSGYVSQSAPEEAMKSCGLDPALKLPVRKYSLGMKQRLGIAQAIMEDRKILILDEPMNGLDKNGTALVRELLLEKKKAGKLIIIASHNPKDIEILCDAVYEIDSGKIV